MKSPRTTLLHTACMAVLFTSVPALADEATTAADPVTLDRVVVTTRLERVPAFDVPASTTTVDLGQGGHNDVNVSDYLDGVPGLLARDRQNYAQDTQISIRGAGARSTFGVRGIRLYSDGIPATMPDGQGQVSHFNLLGGERVEVLRGPFSALYGNSAGGVIQLWSAAPTQAPEFTVQSTYGRDDSWTAGARVRGTSGPVGYNVAVQRFMTDGYRDHSAAERNSGNAKFTFDLGAAGTLDLVGNSFQSDAQDPLGLTWAQVQADRTQATSQAEQYNTRKSIQQNQLGALYTLPVGEHQKVRISAWGGNRKVVQYLSLPITTQANPLNSGGVIDLDNDYGGVDGRWSWDGELARRPLEVTAGSNFERQRQHRTGYNDYVGDVLGVRGDLRRNERNTVENFDQYAQAFWEFIPRWSLLVGARHSQVRFASKDYYIVGTNPDDSGSKDYSETTPVAGLSFAATDDLRFYVSAGRGFETPSYNEIGYRADGGAGLAFDLQPAVSRNYELGAKWRAQSGAHAEVALFRASTHNELAVARNVGGRSSYRNVGDARRQGLELSAGVPLAQDWSLDVAYTYLDATFRDSFPICTAAGCTVANTLVAAGTRIPGTARNQFSTTLGWRHGAWNASLEGEGVSNVSANDQGSAMAPGYFLANLEAGYRWDFTHGALKGFVRVDNLLDQDYIGSVIVNEGNGRYYEPGPGRGVMVGGRWTWGGDGG
ncbi:TonB-dependent receptor [Pseudoxanthomonas sp.]|uniref:TonB-dependent receptor family protein n=1 Tax=Pseudoxanthomonas sp. TaxID=1871049 RepID=UPI00262ABBE5|nr:TonB-dependent receptor [Pseudoxanthomonas sp.]WDS35195.1 MAG: TonB-dependent receptor [Pseudoxanthomonas sp.]